MLWIAVDSELQNGFIASSFLVKTGGNVRDNSDNWLVNPYSVMSLTSPTQNENQSLTDARWIPAFAGMTVFRRVIEGRTLRLVGL